MLNRFLLVIGIILAITPAWTASYYTTRLEDEKAVYLSPGSAGIVGDGVSDDSDAIQKAIDQVQETTSQGIVFIAESRYRLTKTINVWPGIRLIGYGANRPVFVLADNTPGYKDSENERYMIFFSGGRPRASRGGPPRGAPSGGQARGPARGTPGNAPPRDAGAGTFYSAMSNIDLEVGDGNPGAVCVRRDICAAFLPGSHGFPHRIRPGRRP